MSEATTGSQALSLAAELERLREERDELQHLLAEAHKMASLGRLSAGIVHEINTPIGSIFSNNEVLSRTAEKVRALVLAAAESNQPPPAKALALLDTMMSLFAVDKMACERISSVIRSLKTFARVNDSDIREIDLNELLLNTIKLTSCTYRRRVSVETDLGELPKVECYPGLLSQVFLNLIVNASQAIPNEGRILVSTRQESEHVHVSVTDTGTGIRPQDRHKIFAAGFTTKPIGEGTGLGLNITREIVVDTHGGTIDFESEVGVGTTFHVHLPVRQPRREGSL